MNGSCYIIYVQIPDGEGGYCPEVLSSVADSERLAKAICEYKIRKGFIARYVSEIMWTEETSLKFWEGQLCDTQR